MKKLFYSVAYYTGIARLFYFLNRKHQRILNYHHILPENEIENSLLFGYSHTTSCFDKQLHIINKKFGTDTTLGTNQAVITFDDGALNNYKYALPLLEKNDTKAYFFIVGKQLEQEGMLWIDQWYLWLSEVPKGTYTISDNRFTIDDLKSRLKANEYLWEKVTSNYSLLETILKEMDAAYPFSNFDPTKEKYANRLKSMRMEMIENLKEKGHFIGWHSKSHDIFSLLSEESLAKEIKTCKNADWVNTKTIAIPFGTKNETNKRVNNAFINSGFSPILLNQVEPMGANTMGRINLPNTANSHEIHAHLSGLHYFLKHKKLFV